MKNTSGDCVNSHLCFSDIAATSLSSRRRERTDPSVVAYMRLRRLKEGCNIEFVLTPNGELVDKTSEAPRDRSEYEDTRDPNSVFFTLQHVPYAVFID